MRSQIGRCIGSLANIRPTPSMGEVLGQTGSSRTVCPEWEQPHQDATILVGVMCGDCVRKLTPSF